jgi:hypothetical protein
MTQEALAAAIMRAKLVGPDEIPPERWDLYAGTIGELIARELQAAGLSIVSTEDLEGLRDAGWALYHNVIDKDGRRYAASYSVLDRFRAALEGAKP